MAKGQSDASRRAWKLNREYGQLHFLKGLVLTQGSLGVLPQKSVVLILSEVDEAIKANRARLGKSPDITPE